MAKGKRSQQKLTAPTSDYSDAEGNVLTLRGSLTPKARLEYSETLRGIGAKAATTPEDIAQRALELLFERLVTRWEIAGVRIERQRELLSRFRVASTQERQFVRNSLRAHCEEWFPDVQAP